MRKYLLLLVLGGLFVLLFTSSVYAKNGPHLGPGFIADTGACAGCHRSHTGTASRLLFQGSNRYTFCTYCHNGSGAQTNVVTGEFEGYSNSPLPAGKRTTTYDGHNSQLDGVAGDGLNGGGFSSAVPYTGRSGRTGAPVALVGDAQRHNVTGADGVSGYAWGGGTTGETVGIPTGTSEIQNFTCTSCHDPHGTNNNDAVAGPPAVPATERYRILRGGTADSPVNGLVTATIKSNEVFPPPVAPATDAQQKDYTKDMYKEGMADFCVACHTQYKTAMASWNPITPTAPSNPYNAGDGNLLSAKIRHAIDVPLGLNGSAVGIRGQGISVISNLDNAATGPQLPVEQPAGYNTTYNGSATVGTGDEITCLTCHQSHGTAAVMDDGAVGIAPAGSATVNSSQLLRLKNRGVCQDCHNK